MQKINISEHTFLPELIKKEGYVLDLGCVNFNFSLGLKEYCNNIISVDPNLTIKDVPEGISFEPKAIVSNDDKEVNFFIYNDVSGYSLLNPSRDWCILQNIVKVEACNLQDIMTKYNVQQFELIKIDIEGGEYALLENIDWTISKQYTIEFHDFRFMNPYNPNNEIYYGKIMEKMLNYCEIIQHENTDHPGFPPGMGRNYWDSVFVLKKDYWK